MQNAHVSQSMHTLSWELLHLIKCLYFIVASVLYISFSSFVFCAWLDVLSMATASDDFIAPDCRFINIKKGQMVYVYSKLVPEEGAGVFWSGSVCAYLSQSVTKCKAVTNKCDLSDLFEKKCQKKTFA